MAAVGSSRLDLVVLNRAPPVLDHRVLRDGIRIMARDLRATTCRRRPRHRDPRLRPSPASATSSSHVEGWLAPEVSAGGPSG
jgi:hypothetical protein